MTPPVKTPVLNRGFTLVELVAVVVLLGVLATYSATKFSGRQGYSDYALRDQLVSSYRFAQQRAMYDHTAGACYSLDISATKFEPQFNGTFFGDYGQVAFVGDYSGISVTPTTFYFDGLGNVSTANCGGTPVVNPLVLAVGATSVEIYPTGFIRAQ